MQIDYWQKIETIFFEAISMAAEDRENFVREKSHGDEEIFAEVSLLLENDSRDDVFLDDVLFTLGSELLSLDNETILKQQEFAAYKIQKLLGRGGMGLVLLAEDTKLGRLVALKVLPARFAENPEAIAAFQREARAASTVSHQNVAHIYEFGEADGRYFLAMEYIRGRTLREIIKGNSIDANYALDIALQIAAALREAHKNGIVHGDIKPENIIVTEDGLAKVLDFGLAKLINFEETDFSDKPENLQPLIMGTPAYMAPEQIRGRGVSAAGDVWSFGVIFYEMLAGKRPFESETRSEMLAAIQKNEPQPIKISAEITDFISRALSKDVAGRYQNAGELAADLQKTKKNFEISKNTLPVISQIRGLKTSLQSHRKKLIAGFLISIVLLAGLTFLLPKRFFAGLPFGPASIESVAVMPFINDSGNIEEDFLTDGLTESLIGRLSEISELKIKARNSVFYFKGKEYTPRKVGEQLSVQAVLIGHVAERGDDLILNLEMIDAKTEDRIWGKQYFCRKSEAASLQNTVAFDISHQIKNNFSRADEQKLAKVFTQNDEAYQLYLKGRFHWNKRTGKDLQKAVDYYDQAIELDPNFALAYAGRANAYVLFSGYAVSSPRESFPKAEESARKALELDESLAEAHTALSYALFNYDWKFEESEREIRRALELNPNYALAYQWYANANLISAGRLDESIATTKKAIEIDPLSIIANSNLGVAYLYSGRYDEALKQFNKTLELDGNFLYARTYLGRTYLMMGNYQQAISELQKAQQIADDPQLMMLLARTYISMGDREKAYQIIKEFDKLAETRFISPYYYALVYAGLDDKDKAFEWLEKSLQAREGPMTLIKVNPLLQNLQSDARFDDLIKRVGLKR